MPVQGVGDGGWQGQQPLEGTSGPKGTFRGFEGGQKPLKNTVEDAKAAYDEILDDVLVKKTGLNAGTLFNLQLKLNYVLEDPSLSSAQKAKFQAAFNLLQDATKGGEVGFDLAKSFEALLILNDAFK